MRIAYILTSLGIGGAEKQVVALAERMTGRGHSALLLVMRAKQEEQWPAQCGVVYLNMRKNPASIFAGMLRARRTLRAFKPDLVHSHTYPANMLARMLRLGGIAPRVVSTIHNVYEGGWLRMLCYRLTDPLTRHTTAVSTAAAERFVGLKAVPRGKLSVLTNGIDAAEFAPDSARREATRAQLGAGNDFIWLAAGRITSAKDFPNLVQAFAQVWPEISETQAWIAGAEQSDRSGKSGYAAFAAPGGTLQRMRRLGLRRDMPALLDAADGFVLSSAWEGMPLVVGEAMAMGKPVVATDVGGVRELMGGTGSIVPSKDSGALAAAMLEVMRRPLSERETSGRDARERILQSFSMDARANHWEQLYRLLL